MKNKPRPALAQMFRERAERMKQPAYRGFWKQLSGGSWVLCNDPEQCKDKIEELLEIANEYDSPDRYENLIEV